MCTAAATWSRWTAQRTTAGSALRAALLVLGLVAAPLMGVGCASPPEPMQQYIGASQRQMDTVLRQARTETNALRAELAEARIAAAKQESELQELRQQVMELRQTVDARLAEQAQMRAERDKLNEAKNELQTQLVEVPLLRQNLAEAKTSEAKAQAQVKQLQAALVTAGIDVKHSKKGGLIPASKAVGSLKKRTKPVTIAAAADTAVVNSQDSPPPSGESGVLTAAATAGVDSGTRPVTVVKNETLWRIAKRYNLTVEQVQDANGMKDTLIREGQTLIIPSR